MKPDITKLERLMEKGMKHYVLKYGVLYWGVSTALLFSVAFTIVMNMLLDVEVSFFLVLPGALVLFPLGGILWGLRMWSFMEDTYREYLDSEKTAPQDEDESGQ